MTDSSFYQFELWCHKWSIVDNEPSSHSQESTLSYWTKKLSKLCNPM